jgi:hypothetical protein
MRRHPILLCTLALVGVLAAGCAADNQGGGGGGAGNAPTPAPTPTATPSPQPPAGSTPPYGPTVTLVGEVQAGVEAGCLVLEAEQGGGTWLLLGGDRSVLRAGARVQVTGSEAHDLATTCQQGRPFQVTSARPA